MDVKKEVKELSTKLVDNKVPHIIAYLEGEYVSVIIAGNEMSRKEILEAIQSDKDWERAKEKAT